MGVDVTDPIKKHATPEKARIVEMILVMFL
jgi:hypothetical protein